MVWLERSIAGQACCLTMATWANGTETRTCNHDPRPQLDYMNATRPSSLQPDLIAARVLAALLERLDQSAVAVDPQQYQSVVQRLSDTLHELDGNQALEPILDGSLSAAELYENLHYQHAGLCRTPLDSALSAEQLARQWISQAQQRG